MPPSTLGYSGICGCTHMLENSLQIAAERAEGQSCEANVCQYQTFLVVALDTPPQQPMGLFCSLAIFSLHIPDKLWYSWQTIYPLTISKTQDEGEKEGAGKQRRGE